MNAWKYHDDILKKCGCDEPSDPTFFDLRTPIDGSVMRIHGLLGVGCFHARRHQDLKGSKSQRIVI
jgi:hypothetical protein